MSKFIISGFGYVGKATQLSLLEAGIAEDDIGINDPFQEHIVKNWSDAKWHFVCVPTPSVNETDISPYQKEIVLDTIDMASSKGFKGTTVIRSTLDPKSVEDVYKILQDNLIVWPEFLRKASWNTDAVNPILSIAGGARVKQLNSEFNHNFQIQQFMDHPVEACIAKIAINSLLAARTIQAYNLKSLCDNMGYSYTRVRNVISTEPRLGYSHWNQPGPDGEYGYGGSCFPKDTSAMAYAMTSAGIDNSYAEWAHFSNIKVKSSK
jgi:UDPglucose 6-dehydrogenase